MVKVGNLGKRIDDDFSLLPSNHLTRAIHRIARLWTPQAIFISIFLPAIIPILLRESIREQIVPGVPPVCPEPSIPIAIPPGVPTQHEPSFDKLRCRAEHANKLILERPFIPPALEVYNSLEKAQATVESIASHRGDTSTVFDILHEIMDAAKEAAHRTEAIIDLQARLNNTQEMLLLDMYDAGTARLLHTSQVAYVDALTYEIRKTEEELRAAVLFNETVHAALRNLLTHGMHGSTSTDVPVHSGDLPVQGDFNLKDACGAHFEPMASLVRGDLVLHDLAKNATRLTKIAASRLSWLYARLPTAMRLLEERISDEKQKESQVELEALKIAEELRKTNPEKAVGEVLKSCDRLRKALFKLDEILLKKVQQLSSPSLESGRKIDATTSTKPSDRPQPIVETRKASALHSGILGQLSWEMGQITRILRHGLTSLDDLLKARFNPTRVTPV